MSKIERHEVLTVEETAKLLRVNPRAIYGMIHRGELRSIKVGRLFRIPAHQLEALLKKGEKVPASGPNNDFDEEPLSAEDLAAIRRGLEDIRAGRVVTLEEYERKRGL